MARLSMAGGGAALKTSTSTSTAPTVGTPLYARRVNGYWPRASNRPARVPNEFSAIVLAVASTLAAHGEQLRKGDWIITGAATKPAPVAPGDEIKVDMGVLGSLVLTIDQP